MRHFIIKSTLLILFLFQPFVLFTGDYAKECPKEGNAKQQNVKDLNKLKNRDEIPATNQLDNSVTLDKILQLGVDTSRFDFNKGAVIEGYVYDLKLGGIETCNCKTKVVKKRDVHVEIIKDKPDYKKNKKFYKDKIIIVEITPRIRTKIFNQLGVTDEKKMTNTKLKALIKGHDVRITGWLLFDSEHKVNATNTQTLFKGKKHNIWRATCWEIHPVTKLECLDCNPS